MSDSEKLCAEFVRFGGDTDISMTQFASGFSACYFSRFAIFMIARSEATASLFLPCMNAAIGTVKAFVDNTF